MRQTDSEKRESTGRKPHFVYVSADGTPYGLGVSVWNDALCKVVRHLDPSYIDIRQQPYHLMETLRKRMSGDFEYSEPLNLSWLRGRVSGALSLYRHELMKMIEVGE